MSDKIKNRAKALLRRFEVHKSAMIRRIRRRGIHSDVAIDREIGKYLEGTYGLESRILGVIAKHSRADAAIRSRQLRIDRENEESIEAERKKATYLAWPAKSVDAAVKQHEAYTARR